MRQMRLVLDALRLHPYVALWPMTSILKILKAF